MSFFNSILPLVVLTVVGIVISVPGFTTLHFQQRWKCCGSVAYDPRRSHCCGYELLALPDVNVSSYGCCFDRNFKTRKLYNTATHACCYGQEIKLPDLEDLFHCCNGQLYRLSSQMCCGNEISDNGCGDNWCCGFKTVYDSTTQMCCRGGKDLQWQTWVAEMPSNTSVCCGLNGYDYRYDACCNGIVVPKKAGIGEAIHGECCGSEAYDTSKQGCCGHKTLYNLKTQICCDTVGSYIALVHEVADRTSDTDACCGLKVYDYKYEACCEDVLQPKKTGFGEAVLAECCSTVAYDNAKQICCDKWGKTSDTTYGIVAYTFYNISRQDSTLSCCGTTLYSTRDAFCCNDDEDTLLPKPMGTGSDKDMKCCGGQLITNITIQSCVSGTIIELEGRLKLCNGKKYDPSIQVCCDNNLHDLRDGEECCWGAGAMYDPEVQSCCGGRIQQLTQEDLVAK